MEGELLKYLSTLGIGGILAAFIFYFYRQDRKASDKQLQGLMGDYQALVKANNLLQQEHIKILSELYTWLRAKNGNRD